MCIHMCVYIYKIVCIHIQYRLFTPTCMYPCCVEATVVKVADEKKREDEDSAAENDHEKKAAEETRAADM